VDSQGSIHSDCNKIFLFSTISGMDLSNQPQIQKATDAHLWEYG